MSKLFPPTHSTFTPPCWRNNHLYWTYTLELTRLDLQQLQLRLLGKPGDVLLVAMWDHLIFHDLTRWWHENLATTDYVHCRTPLPQTATMLTPGPFIFLLSTCPAEHAPRSHLLNTSSHPMTWSVQLYFNVLLQSGVYGLAVWCVLAEFFCWYDCVENWFMCHHNLLWEMLCIA